MNFVPESKSTDIEEDRPLRHVPSATGQACAIYQSIVMGEPTAAPPPTTAKPPRKKRRTTDPAPTLRALFDAAEASDDGLQLLLLRTPDDVLQSARDGYGWTLLMSACAAGSISNVSLLLSRVTRGDSGTNYVAEQRDHAGRSALDIAITKGHHQIANLLALFARPEQAGGDDEEKEEVTAAIAASSTTTTATPAAASQTFCTICRAKVLTGSLHSTTISHLVACQHTQPPSRPFVLGENSKGFRLLRTIGWDGETGLGPAGRGGLTPVKSTLRESRAGIGAPGVPAPRVTHFQAFDERAVQRHGPAHPLAKNSSAAAAQTLRENLAAHRHERAQEQRLRRYLNEP